MHSKNIKISGGVGEKNWSWPLVVGHVLSIIIDQLFFEHRCAVAISGTN